MLKFSCRNFLAGRRFAGALAVTSVVVQVSSVPVPNQKLGSIDRMGNRRMGTLVVEAVWRLEEMEPDLAWF